MTSYILVQMAYSYGVTINLFRQQYFHMVLFI